MLECGNGYSAKVVYMKFTLINSFDGDDNINSSLAGKQAS